MVGSQLVFAAYVTYYLRKSTDKSVVQSLTVSKILVSRQFFLLGLYSRLIMYMYFYTGNC